MWGGQRWTSTNMRVQLCGFCVLMLSSTLQLYCIVHSLCTLGRGLSVAIEFGLRGTAMFSAGYVPLQWFPSALIKIATLIWSVIGVWGDLGPSQRTRPCVRWMHQNAVKHVLCHLWVRTELICSVKCDGRAWLQQSGCVADDLITSANVFGLCFQHKWFVCLLVEILETVINRFCRIWTKQQCIWIWCWSVILLKQTCQTRCTILSGRDKKKKR